MKVRRFSTRMSLLGCMLLCTLAPVVSGLALPGCGGSGTGGGATGRRLVEITLHWDSPGDVDLHLWRPAGNQCSKDGCSNTGVRFFGDNRDTGPEAIDIYDTTQRGTYKVGVNLHSLNGVNLSGEWIVYIIVTRYPDDARKQVTSYNYTLTTPIADGGYPVTGDTDSWWRPIDIAINDYDGGTDVVINSPSNNPLNK